VKKSIAIAAAFTSMMFAGSAFAADQISAAPERTVRVPVANKSMSQLRTEIRTAARQVCDGLGVSCLDYALRDARLQLTRVSVAQPERAVSQEDRPVKIRVRVAGLGEVELNRAIVVAAETVCTNAGARAYELRACVDQAVADAQSQLRVNRPAA
jgi:hypothetical protein